MKRIALGLLGLAWIGAAQAQTVPLPPASPPTVREPAGDMPASRAGAAQSATRTEMQDLIDAATATAKATREGVDYSRVVPDILQQILAKLDKIEDKLDKIETNRSPARKR